METPAHTADEPIPAEPLEERPPGGRIEHSLLSILVVAILSAGSLFLVDWLLRDDGVLVRGWDFTRPDESGVWAFPEGSTAPGLDGVGFEMEESGFGPAMQLSFAAEDVRRMQATLTVTDAETGEPVPFALGFYWANTDDIAASPEEPFAGIRSMVFYPFARHRPDSYRLDLHKHSGWKGTIEQGVLTIKFPQNAAGPFRVHISRLEFLE